jgi:hypothetical protein
LRADAAECVEDGVVGGTGEGVLAVQRDAIRDDAFLGEATCDPLELYALRALHAPKSKAFACRGRRIVSRSTT